MERFNLTLGHMNDLFISLLILLTGKSNTTWMEPIRAMYQTHP